MEIKIKNLLQHHTSKKLSAGKNFPLGASVSEEGVNFAVFSKHAAKVYLLLFDEPQNPPTDIIKIENKTKNVWHVFVHGLQKGQLYGYKADGEYNPEECLNFNPYKLIIDPYAKALSGKCKNEDNLLFSYDVNAAVDGKDFIMDKRDNVSIVPKSIVIDDAFDWEGISSPSIPMNKLIIYETHLKGFTAHKSSGVKHPGTYFGFIEKIPYLKKLGINAVEFMPVHEFYVRDELVKKGLTDYWGYNSISFFAPESSYSSCRHLGCQVREFKTLVKELHKAGIEVILDVVYNHTGEGNQYGPSLSFKAIDNTSYYLIEETRNKDGKMACSYKDDTGCGNTVKAENPVVMRLILDSLRYWVEAFHIDGFRFDLASTLARVKDKFSTDALFFSAVSKCPVLSKIKIIAEPWDYRSYNVGNFPPGWSEWNDKFRDTVRKFIRGDEGQIPDLAWRLTGSADLYQDDGRKPYNSVNFITCHDGFPLADLFSYNNKHNQDNREDNKDGLNENYSWNCGVEGETNDAAVSRLRKKMIKNAFCCLLFSLGTPMLLSGDEITRTQRGNNNAYCQDSEISWFNWDMVKKNADIFEFCKKAIAFRKKYPVLHGRKFFTGKDIDGNKLPDIAWFDKNLKTPDWNNPKLKTLCFLFDGHDTPSINNDYLLFFMLNAGDGGSVISLPEYKDIKWRRIVNTALKGGYDFCRSPQGRKLKNQKSYYCSGRSVVVLLGK
ncbi:MAG: glycogen debranching protein GlgX [Candidatus Omnitrophota bacterium]